MVLARRKGGKARFRLCEGGGERVPCTFGTTGPEADRNLARISHAGCTSAEQGLLAAGSKIMVLARREGGKVSFRLREGVGVRVPRAPWRIEWGGGASIENPHFQRVHYCQLLARPTPSL